MLLTAAAVDHVQLCHTLAAIYLGMTRTGCTWPCQAYLVIHHVIHVPLPDTITCVTRAHNHALHGYALENVHRHASCLC